MDPYIASINSAPRPLPVDAGDFVDNLGGGNTPYSQLIMNGGRNQIMGAITGQNYNTASLDDQGSHDFRGINLTTTGVQDGVENSEPKIVSDHFIRQGRHPTVLRGDIVFIPPHLGPSGNKNRTRSIGYGVALPAYSGSPNLFLSPIEAKNLTQVNQELHRIQIAKLKGKVVPGDRIFHSELLGGIEQYLNLYKCFGVLYHQLDSEPSMTYMGDDDHSIKYDAPGYGSRPSKLVSFIHQGHNFIQDIWGGTLTGGTNLFLVLKPTLISAGEQYVTQLDDKPGKEFNDYLLPGIAPNPVKDMETYVIYQWQPAARCGYHYPDTVLDLSYHAKDVRKNVFGKEILLEHYSVTSAAYIRIGQVKHTVSEGVLGQPRALSMATDYKQVRSTRRIEVDVFDQLVPTVIS